MACDKDKEEKPEKPERQKVPFGQLIKQMRNIGDTRLDGFADLLESIEEIKDLLIDIKELLTEK